MPQKVQVVGRRYEVVLEEQLEVQELAVATDRSPDEPGLYVMGQRNLRTCTLISAAPLRSLLEITP